MIFFIYITGLIISAILLSKYTLKENDGFIFISDLKIIVFFSLFSWILVLILSIAYLMENPDKVVYKKKKK